ncbi:competence protein ComK [Fictibacillus sp. Mic-4]|uniref:Rok-like winged helix domain-containing protein n=1 Tax=Fictibacillus TaxID=1329200 RepID=UPI00041F19DC|nr:hypothetical protein [Fictibacillus gelatini]
MFDERIALKIRLEQMNDAEERLAREFQKEREIIFNRLRELDQMERLQYGEESEANEGAKEILAHRTENNRNDEPASEQAKPGKRGRRRGNSNDAALAAVKILKNYTSAVKSSDLRKEIEKEIGHEISNFTLFMNRVINLEPNIQKPYRGHYLFVPNEDKEEVQVAE